MARIGALLSCTLMLQMLLSMPLVNAMPVVSVRSASDNGDYASNSALTIAASNTTSDYTKAFQISVEAGSPSVSMTITAIINPLTQDASRTDSSNVTYQGTLQAYSANSSVALSGSIAYISCDDSSVFLAVVQAVEQSPECILLYSTMARTCDFTSSYRLYNGELGAVFSTLSASIGRQLLSAIKNNPNSLLASVVTNETRAILDSAESQTSTSVEFAMATTTVTATETSETTSASTTTGLVFTTGTPAPQWSSSGQDTQSSGHTTAVAMIILYSVTGLVSGFFLLVIILGAIRAHRHPERYQVTTNPDGTVHRTNRARGLAKAVLDSIPLVKVPEHRHHHRHSDETVERTEDGNDNIKMVELDPSSGREVSQPDIELQPKVEEDSQNVGDIANPAAEPTEGRMSIDGDSNSSTVSIPSALMIPTDGCPICFEPFLPGQDLRVLPCHHGFHAACVDPWLLNSSSQCPLCRVDLNLRAGAEIPDMPPGLMPNGTEGRSDAELAGALNGNGLNSRLNRLLDTWNAQLLPREERRIAMERLHEEDRIRREMRRRREEHMRSETGGPRTWRRFVEGRRRLFNLQQQRERRQAEEDQRQSSEHGASSSAHISASDAPRTSQNGQT
ncbi:hypothetical protein POJ06DRAFT_279736 [Lipomyces tetrasporus]|uniref:RING-type domain-containing protein n=1 Tax=Lipomyces tetrasporus TaxID=54092 RepID=A0AAD7VWY6_9ASCO|nr:uncharacterized protein POJ06DRAFT_279736 [Lipomyces tetrasporus]KAJ8104245.1 hypothetical protein POJ06DRAFT_279736 [Lipomyces tetrasporus]